MRVWLLYGGFVVFTWLVFGWFDELLLKWVQGRDLSDNLNAKWVRSLEQEQWFERCRWLHKYTKFEWLNLSLALGFLIVGFLKAKSEWRRIGLAILLAGGLAGLLGQTLKTVTGRPRPSTLIKDEMAQNAYDFRGPTLEGGWRGYPSGHSAAAWGSCVALAYRRRKWAIPLILIAVLVSWSRMYGNYHWPTDVLHGSGLGAVFGWFWGRSQTEEK